MRRVSPVRRGGGGSGTAADNGVDRPSALDLYRAIKAEPSARLGRKTRRSRQPTIASNLARIEKRLRSSSTNIARRPTADGGVSEALSDTSMSPPMSPPARAVFGAGGRPRCSIGSTGPGGSGSGGGGDGDGGGGGVPNGGPDSSVLPSVGAESSISSTSPMTPGTPAKIRRTSVTFSQNTPDGQEERGGAIGEGVRGGSLMAPKSPLPFRRAQLSLPPAYRYPVPDVIIERERTDDGQDVDVCI